MKTKGYLLPLNHPDRERQERSMAVLYAEGWTYKMVGTYYRVHPDTVARLVGNWGVAPHPRSWVKPASAVLTKKVIELRQAGLTYREIGEKLDISPQSARRRYDYRVRGKRG